MSANPADENGRNVEHCSIFRRIIGVLFHVLGILMYVGATCRFAIAFLTENDFIFQIAGGINCIILASGLYNAGTRIKARIPSRIVIGKIIGTFGWLFVCFSPYIFIANDEYYITSTLLFIVIGVSVIMIGRFVSSETFHRITAFVRRHLAFHELCKFPLSLIRYIRKSFRRIEEATRP